jgi:chromosome segregation ATPase
MQMRVNTTTDFKFINELSRRQHIFSNFMESFNTGAMLPPVMVNVYKRIEALETAKKIPDVTPEPVNTVESQQNVDTLIATVDEPLIKECPHRAHMEATIKEMRDKIAKLTEIINGKDKEITKLNTSIIQLNASLEDVIKHVHELSKQAQAKPVEITPVEQNDTSMFATKVELKDTEKRIVKELTDKIDAEMIDAEERFEEKIKTSIETIKLALDETVGGEEEDAEEDEEEDIDVVIDMN